MRKLATAYRVWRGKGIGGVFSASAVLGAETALAILRRASRTITVQRDYFYDYWANRNLVAPNRQLENIHAGRRAFIIGTGPSLAHQDLSHLRGEVTFAVNSFWMHPAIGTVRPAYYVLTDPDFFEDSAPSREVLRKMTAAANAAIFIVGASYGYGAVESGWLPRERTKFVSFAGLLHDSDITWPALHHYVPGVHNVALVALMSAMYMGCNPIYLMGCDHNYGQKVSGPWDHFHAEQVIPGRPSMTTFDLGSEYAQAATLWTAYRHLRKIACSRGVSILNATHGGHLDVFDRANYSSLFENEVVAK